MFRKKDKRETRLQFRFNFTLFNYKMLREKQTYVRNYETMELQKCKTPEDNKIACLL